MKHCGMGEVGSSRDVFIRWTNADAAGGAAQDMDGSIRQLLDSVGTPLCRLRERFLI